jgi:hypothetical protein
MKKSQLRKMIRQAIDEIGAVKQDNKAKKRSHFAQQGTDAMNRDWRVRGRESQANRVSIGGPAEPFGQARVQAGDADHLVKDPSRKFQAATVRAGRGDIKTPDPRKGTPSGPDGKNLGPNQTPSGGQKTPAPANVQAAVQQGGRVVFGHYYDATGTPLGKSMGGKWIPANSPEYKSRQLEVALEVYQKIQEIENAGYTSKDRKMVKEMMREVLRSCG